MNIAYITAQTPYCSKRGNGEQFIPPEILEIIKKGNKVIVIPLRPGKNVEYGTECRDILNNTVHIPLISPWVIINSFFKGLKHFTKVVEAIFKVLTRSGGIKKAVKNLLVVPKAILTADIVMKNNIEHIHAHWASTPSTTAYIASKISGIPWSFTAHRWDISENNMLREKANEASFIRVISKDGYDELIELIDKWNWPKCNILHMGVHALPHAKRPVGINQQESFVIATPARLCEKKGHIYLIKSLKNLKDMGYENILCNFYGDGELEEDIKKTIREYGLEDILFLKGRVARDELLKMYTSGDIDCVVLPSIVAGDGDKEGIPVALMEAMACQVPVISTDTGGISELLGDGAGIIIDQKSDKCICTALRRIIADKSLRESLREKGYEKVMREFYLPSVVEKLLAIMGTTQNCRGDFRVGESKSFYNTSGIQ